MTRDEARAVVRAARESLERKQRRQWADHYGPQWYRHKDGTPPHDDDHDYLWHPQLQQWVRADLYEDFEL